MANSTTNLDTLTANQAQKEVAANALADASSPATAFGRRASTCAALTWGYYGGTVLIGGTPTQVANGTVALSASLTNYIELTPAGAVVKNTSGWTPGYVKLYAAVCGASTVTSYTDWRLANVYQGMWNINNPITDTFAGTMTMDWSKGTIHRVTLTANITSLTFSNAVDGQNCIVEVTQGGSGSYTVAWPGTVRWPSDVPSPVLTTTVGKMDRIGFIYNSGASKYDVVAVVKGY